MPTKIIIKTYSPGFIGKKIRETAEKELFAKGYIVLQEETVKEWDAGTACCLLIIFFPLIFLAKLPRVRVTYQLSE